LYVVVADTLEEECVDEQQVCSQTVKKPKKVAYLSRVNRQREETAIQIVDGGAATRERSVSAGETSAKLQVQATSSKRRS
jgi:hypothetical protein